MSDHPLTAADVAALRERGSTSTAAEVVARLCDDWGRLAAENVRLRAALEGLLGRLDDRWEGHPEHKEANRDWNRRLQTARAALADSGPAGGVG